MWEFRLTRSLAGCSYQFIFARLDYLDNFKTKKKRLKCHTAVHLDSQNNYE